MPADWKGLEESVRITQRRLWILAARLFVLYVCDALIVWSGIHYGAFLYFATGVATTAYTIVLTFEAYESYVSLQLLKKEIARYVRR